MTVRRELKHELRTHPAGSVAGHAIQNRITRLDDRLVRLRDDRRAQTRVEAELRDETSLRARLLGQAWFVEQVQRDVAREQHPGTGVKQGAVLNTAALREAQHRWRTATEIQRGLWLETQLRTFQPDRSINQRPAGVPAWAVPGRGLGDTHLPTSWREPLTDMAGTVATAIRDRGASIALNPTPWATTYLGPVPSTASPLRARWEDLAGKIDTWRGLTGHQDPAKALPAPSRSRDASRVPVRDLHVLHTAASDLRRDSRLSRAP